MRGRVKRNQIGGALFGHGIGRSQLDGPRRAPKLATYRAWNLKRSNSCPAVTFECLKGIFLHADSHGLRVRRGFARRAGEKAIAWRSLVVAVITG